MAIPATRMATTATLAFKLMQPPSEMKSSKLGPKREADVRLWRAGAPRDLYSPVPRARISRPASRGGHARLAGRLKEDRMPRLRTLLALLALALPAVVSAQNGPDPRENS